MKILQNIIKPPARSEPIAGLPCVCVYLIFYIDTGTPSENKRKIKVSLFSSHETFHCSYIIEHLKPVYVYTLHAITRSVPAVNPSLGIL